MLNNQNFINNNNNSLNNNLNNQSNKIKGNNSNYYSELASPKKSHLNMNVNESNELNSNFSDIINFEDINNVIKQNKTNEVYINNPYGSLNHLKKRSNSKLEIRELDFNENNFKNLNNFSHKNSTIKDRNSIITSGKKLSDLTAYSQNDGADCNKENFNLNKNNENQRINSNSLDKNNFDIFERLNGLKIRARQVLTAYAENFIVRK